MTLPAPYRINYATRGSASATTNYGAVPGTGGTAAVTNITTTPKYGTRCNRVTWSVANTAIGGGVYYDELSGLVASTAYAFSLWVRPSRAQQMALVVDCKNSAAAIVNTLTGATIACPANVWTQLTVTGTSGAAVDRATLSAIVQATGVLWVAADTLDIDGIQIETGSTVTSYFNGDNAPNASVFRTYEWVGVAQASVSREIYYGMYAEVVAGSGMPRTSIYAAGLGNAAVTCQITRQVGNLDQWTVPGWRARSVTNADATMDWFVPLAVPVTYTLFVNGQALNSVTITVASSTGWLCDPLQPDQAMPMAVTGANRTVLALAKGTMRGITYDGDPSYERPAGSRYVVARAGIRSAGDDIPMSWLAHNNNTNDQCRTLIAGASIVLFKPVPSWGAPSSLMYFAAPIKETPLNRDRGGADTSWSMSGPLVLAVSQPPISGAPTYDDVKTNIGVRTYASVQSSSGYKRYVDVQANPLGLGS